MSSNGNLSTFTLAKTINIIKPTTYCPSIGCIKKKPIKNFLSKYLISLTWWLTVCDNQVHITVTMSLSIEQFD